MQDCVESNQTSTNLPPINGNYDFAMQLVAWGSNGPAISPMTTQTVSVVKGVFTVPMRGDPVTFGNGSVRYLNMGVKSSTNPGPQQFLTTPLLITTPGGTNSITITPPTGNFFFRLNQRPPPNRRIGKQQVASTVKPKQTMNVLHQ
jgi:hypothetical protein